MKTMIQNVAIAAVGFIAAACFVYISLYLVIVGALIGLAYAIVGGLVWLRQRVLRWWDDRAHQAFIDDVIRTAKAPPARIEIR